MTILDAKLLLEEPNQQRASAASNSKVHRHDTKKPNLTSLPCLLLLSVLLLLFADSRASAQTASFTYEGRLTQAGNSVTGIFDMRFKLFDTATVGTGAQQGGEITNSTVPVTNGLFIVTLDFGASVFNGSPRFLEIGVRPASNAGPYSILAPRQQVASIPYAIQSLNAAQLNGRPATSFVQANTDGNVGIGPANPAPGIRLEVNGATLLTPGGSGGEIEFHTPSAETGMTIAGANRADVRFDGLTLKLLAGAGLGPPSSVNGIAINTSGNVGIGTTSPTSKLEIAAQDGLAITGFQPFLTLRDTSASNARSIIQNGSGNLLFYPQSFVGSAPALAIFSGSGYVGIGTTTPVAKLHVETSQANTAAVYGNATAAGGVGVYGQSAAGAAVHAEGNAVQVRDKGGFVKAMAYINPFLPASQYVVRCYNSQQAGNATSTAPCGITVTRNGPGYYLINFGFKVDDRFISISPVQAPAGSAGIFPTIFQDASNSVGVGMADSGKSLDSAFYIIVY